MNPLDFPGGEALLRRARPMAERIAALQQRTRAANIPTVYVNDNFGAWHLGFRELVEQVRGGSAPGRALLDAISPDPREDYFVLKPMHSGFFGTALELLLRRLGARTLILTGIACDICVLMTAADAYMRGFALVVPSDCAVSERESDESRALDHMRRVLRAEVRPAAELRFRAAADGGRVESPPAEENRQCSTT